MTTGANGEAPQSYTWTFPICPHDVAIDFAAVRALAAEPAAEPCQGLLFGQRHSGLTRIAAVEPVAALDAESFAAAIARSRHPVVGYYRIREGCAFILEPAEIALAKSVFPEPGSVVLLAERRESGAPEATFAFWRGEAFVSNLPRPFRLDPEILAAQPQPAPGLPEPVESRLALLRRHAAPVGLVAAAVLGIVVLPLIWMHSGPLPDRGAPLPAAPAAPVPAPALTTPALSVVAHAPGDIQIAWDRGALSGATAGLLKIEDGGVHHHVSLDLGQLRFGSIVYSPGPGPVTAELKVLLPDGDMLEVPVSERAAPSPPPPAPVSVPVAAVAPPPAAPRVAPPRQFPFPSPPPLERRQVAKRFELPSAAAVRPPAGAPALPDAPAVHPPAQAAAPLTASISAPPAPPKSAPAPSRIRLGPPPLEHGLPSGTGRLIWTGTLERRGVIEFEGRSASVGSLTGSLPGVPVHVNVSPAEFGSDGLVVYTTDARLNGHVEAPSAANGWNRITYSFDPERARQIAVLESPNPSNKFSHLALRSDARRVSMLVIDWKAATTTAATR